MESDLQVLRERLEADDIPNFLSALVQVPRTIQGNIEFTFLTQIVLPPVLREWLASEALPDHSIIQLWTLVNSGLLLIVENDLLSAINSRLDTAWSRLKGGSDRIPSPLPLYGDGEGNAPPTRQSIPPNGDSNSFFMKRIVLRSAFMLTSFQTCDIENAKKNLCASSQEREFLKAVRQFLPNLWVYPNVPLRNFIRLDQILPPLSTRHHYYSRTAEVDILVCSHDEDPIAGFELDSALHDTDSAQEKDKLKNQVFASAGIPLLRIRADDTSNVRAEDFYALLMAEKEILDKLRPPRLRPRRNHDSLVPAQP